MITNQILLVEDDENDVILFHRAVIKAGMTNPVQIARHGQEAIDYLRGDGRFAERAKFPLPLLILLDLKLPFVMGLDVLNWIRQESGLAPIVVMLSSSGEEADVAAAYRLGANGYLVKPAEIKKLADMVRAITDFWLTQNTPPPPCPKMGRVREAVTDRRDQYRTGYPCTRVSNSHSSSGILGSDL